MLGKDLEEVLKSYGFDLKSSGIVKTLNSEIHELAVSPALRVSSLKSRLLDISVAIGCDIRLHVPYKRGLIGFELRSHAPISLLFEDVIKSVPEGFSSLSIPVGMDAFGKLRFFDFLKTTHLLIAGSSGSGKSSYIKCVIEALRRANTANEVRIVLMDPKGVDFTCYANDAFLYNPIAPYSVVKSAVDCVKILGLLIVEMKQRLSIFGKEGYLNIHQYIQSGKKMPRIVVIIDEFAELLSCGDGAMIESCVTRLGQLARAAGIHLIVATQRPTVAAVSNSIKVNFPTRIAFRLPTNTDYMSILGECPDNTDSEAIGSAWVKSPEGEGLFHVQTCVPPKTVSIKAAPTPEFRMTRVEGLEELEKMEKPDRGMIYGRPSGYTKSSYTFKIWKDWSLFIMAFNSAVSCLKHEEGVDAGEYIQDFISKRITLSKEKWGLIIRQAKEIGIVTEENTINLDRYNDYYFEDKSRLLSKESDFSRYINSKYNAWG